MNEYTIKLTHDALQSMSLCIVCRQRVAEVTFDCFVPRQFKGPHQYNGYSDNLRKMIP